MADYEYNIQMRQRDRNGNNYFLYPKTKLENVEGADELVKKVDNKVDKNDVAGALAAEYLPKVGGALSGSLDFTDKEAWVTPYLLAFKNADPDSSPTYPYTGFYQWGDEWQVNARDANNRWMQNILAINLATKVANFSAIPTVDGENLALRSDIPGVATLRVDGLMSAADKTKLTQIQNGANYYVLPAATSDSLGGVNIGSNISISNGTISLSKDNVTSALGYTPPDTNTTYSAGTGISLSGTTFSNSGVRSVGTGSDNGTISVNTNGTSANVAVKGLGSAAYTNSNAYAPADHGHSNYLPTSGGTVTAVSGDTALNVQSQADSSYIGFNRQGGGKLGYIGINSVQQPVFYNTKDNVILHAGNFSSYAALAPIITQNDIVAGTDYLETGRSYHVYE